MFELFHSMILDLNDNAMLTGIISVIINILSRFVVIKLSDSTEKIIKNTVAQEILFFLICFVSTKNLYIAIALTVIFIIFLTNIIK
jgi:hypothetical protein